MNLKVLLYLLAIITFVVGAVLCAVDKTLTTPDALEVAFIGFAFFVGGHLAPPVT